MKALRHGNHWAAILYGGMNNLLVRFYSKFKAEDGSVGAIEVQRVPGNLNSLLESGCSPELAC